MKLLFQILIALLLCIPAHSADRAGSVQFLLSQVRTSAGYLYGGKVYFYEPGTTTTKTIWTDRTKLSAAANPYTLDSNGTAQLYADGLYRIIIKDSAGVTKYDRDNLWFGDWTAAAGEGLSLSTDYSNDIAAAITAIGSTVTTLVCDDTFTVASGTTPTLNVNTTWDPRPGCTVQGVAGGGVETLNIPSLGNIPESLVWIGADVVVNFTGEAPVARPKWWGNNDGSDFYDELTSALASVSSGKTGKVLLEDFYHIASKLTIPSGVDVEGVGRMTSGIILDGDIDGVEVHQFSNLSNFRIIGNADMAATKSCLILGNMSGTYNSARSNLTDMIIGGSTTELGDDASVRCTGLAIGGTNTFLNNLTNLYVVNALVGYDNPIAANRGVNNALKFSGVEFHSCGTGMKIARPNGVALNTVTFENNDNHGLIVGESRSMSLNNTYFESNHANSTAAIKADFLISPAAVGGTDPAAAINGSGFYFASSGNSEYGLYANIQRNIDFSGLMFNAGYNSATNTVYVGSSAYNSGVISNIFGTTTVAPSNNSASLYLENYEYTGSSYLGKMQRKLFFSRSGSTASLTAGTGTEGLFTPTAGESYLLSIHNAANSVDSYWLGTITAHAASTMIIEPIKNLSQEITNVGGVVTLTNTGGSNSVFNWSAIRVQ